MELREEKDSGDIVVSYDEQEWFNVFYFIICINDKKYNEYCAPH